MIRPIETNLSILNVEQKASQVKDPNAHQYAAMQRDEIVKSAQLQAQNVPIVEKTEGDVKVRERREDPEERRGRRQGKNAAGNGDDRNGQGEDSAEPGPEERAGLDFLA